MIKRKDILRCPICESIFTSHEDADRHASSKDHWGDYDPYIKPKILYRNESAGINYNFTTDIFDKDRPVEVRSKGHYKSLLKKYGMADASPKECFDQARKCAKNNEVSRQVRYKQRAKVIAERFHENNVSKEGKEILQKLTKRRKGV